jgi:hypothetical protein
MNKCYYVSKLSEINSFTKAEDTCKLYGGHLVSLHTASEIDYVNYIVNKSFFIRICLNMLKI